MNKFLIGLAISAAATSVAFADQASTRGWYISGSYAQLDADIADVVEFDLAALVFNGGYQINEYVAFETRLGTGVADDDIFGVKLELDYLMGIYTKVGIPTGTAFYPYVVLGYTKAELTVSDSGFSESDSDNDTSYGVGAHFTITESLGVFAEYMNWYDKDDLEVTGFNIGANYKF